MKTKTSNLGRLVVLVLIAIILITTVAYAADAKAGNGTGGNTQATDLSETKKEEDSLPKKPKYNTYLTGEETQSPDTAAPTGVLVRSGTEVYGISSADIVTEIPLEGGETRLLLTFSDVSDLGKVGAILPTRKYMTNFAYYLGAPLVFSGTDGSVADSGYDALVEQADLSRLSGASYTEYGASVYSNGILLSGALEKLGIDTVRDADKTLPFAFSSLASGGSVRASAVTVPYLSSGASSFVYDAATKTYRYQKNAAAVTDPLTDTAAGYGNVLILFADCVTYETAERTESVFDTTDGGSGYALFGGTLTKFTWGVGDDGQMLFRDAKGARLTLPAGRSFIAVVKSSKKADIRIE